MGDTLPRRSDGTIQSQRIKQPWPKDKPFYILSIDGGGICGILPASILAELENRFLDGRSIVDSFDMIAGTSTGGIIALGLGAGKTAAEIRDIYVKNGGKIFPRGNLLVRCVRFLRHWVRYKYDSEALHEELLQVFGSKRFGESKVALCIPSFEGRFGEPWLYKTPHHPDYKNDQYETMVRVAMATAAAPTYFQAFQNSGYVMVDGGIWANNPVMNALVDALACYDIDRRQVRILSLGCGETTFKVKPVQRNGGFFQWRKIIKAAMRAQSKNALGQAFLLVGKDQVLRLDAPETLQAIDLDDHLRASKELPNMARSLVEASGQMIAEQFLKEFQR